MWLHIALIRVHIEQIMLSSGRLSFNRMMLCSAFVISSHWANILGDKCEVYPGSFMYTVVPPDERAHRPQICELRCHPNAQDPLACTDLGLHEPIHARVHEYIEYCVSLCMSPCMVSMHVSITHPSWSYTPPGCHKIVYRYQITGV